MQYYKINYLGTPGHPSDAATKYYVDQHKDRLRRDLESHLQEDSDADTSVFQRNVDMQNHKIQNLGLCTTSSDAANKGYVDSAGIISVLNLAACVYIDGYS